MSRQIYLDTAAATPLDERVFAAMQPFLFEQFYNPSSAYRAGRAVRAAVDEARRVLAGHLGVKAGEIIMTAGATESANLAIHGVMRQFPQARVAVSAIEHQAVLEAAKQYNHDFIQPETTGRIQPEALAAAITDDTVLVSIGYVNSELGTMQPLRKLAATIQAVRAKRHKTGNSLPLYFHADATQAVGYADVHVQRLGVDLLTLSASKIYGPKQVGLLFVKHGTRLQPLLHGGGQEAGLRAGTENVAGVVGLAKALDLAQTDRHEHIRVVSRLRDAFEADLQRAIPELQLQGDMRSRAPHISHFSIAGLDAETLLFMLDERGIMLATGAACAANKGTASHVLQAIGLETAAVQSSLRASFGWNLEKAEVAQAAQTLADCARQLKGQHAPH